jgi:predicted transposase YdaD
VFPRRSLEPIEVEPYRDLLESDRVTRLYLSELGDVAERSLGVGIIKLVVETKKRTPELVRQLVEKARSEMPDEALQRQVLDLIETIVLYKLPLISRQELAHMFSLSDLKKTRYYQEVKEEVQEEFREVLKEEVKAEVRHEEALELILRLLARRFGRVNLQLQQRVHHLSVMQLENLAEALLDFSSEADLGTWLDENSNQSGEE